MIKRIAYMLLIVLLLGGFAFAEGQKEEQQAEGEQAGKQLPEEITIGWSPPDVTGVFATATNYFEKAAKDAREAGINAKVVTQSPAAHTEFGKQVNILQDFISRDVDVIAVSPVEVEVIKPALRKANQEDIPIIVVNLLRPIEGVDVDSYIGFSNYGAAKISGYATLDYFGGPGVLNGGDQVDRTDNLNREFWEDLYSDVGPENFDPQGKIAILEGIAGGFFNRERMEGYHDVIDQYDGLEVVASLAADWNRQKAVDNTEDILQAHPDVDLIYGASNEMGIGARYAVESADKGDEVVIITNDGTPESLKMIRNDRILAETWHGFPEWGWFGTRFAVMLALGQDPPQEFDINPRLEYKGNADNFYPDVKLEPHPWEEIKQTYMESGG